MFVHHDNIYALRPCQRICYCYELQQQEAMQQLSDRMDVTVCVHRVRWWCALSMIITPKLHLHRQSPPSCGVEGFFPTGMGRCEKRVRSSGFYSRTFHTSKQNSNGRIYTRLGVVLRSNPFLFTTYLLPHVMFVTSMITLHILN